MIDVRSTGIDSAQRRLTSLKTKLEGGMASVSPHTIDAIDQIVREHDVAVFLRGARSDWDRITLPTALFSRKSTSISPAKTIQQAVAAAAADLLPLIDTGRLFNSIAQNNADHIIVVMGSETLIIGTSVDYAAKHWNGAWQTFDVQLGSEELTRFDSRFVKPSSGQDRERDYYRLKTWAKDRYPVKAFVPARSWYEPLSMTDRARIGELIANDEINLL